MIVVIVWFHITSEEIIILVCLPRAVSFLFRRGDGHIKLNSNSQSFQSLTLMQIIKTLYTSDNFYQTIICYTATLCHIIRSNNNTFANFNKPLSITILFALQYKVYFMTYAPVILLNY